MKLKVSKERSEIQTKEKKHNIVSGKRSRYIDIRCSNVKIYFSANQYEDLTLSYLLCGAAGLNCWAELSEEARIVSSTANVRTEALRSCLGNITLLNSLGLYL